MNARVYFTTEHPPWGMQHLEVLAEQMGVPRQPGEGDHAFMRRVQRRYAHSFRGTAEGIRIAFETIYGVEAVSVVAPEALPGRLQIDVYTYAPGAANPMPGGAANRLNLHQLDDECRLTARDAIAATIGYRIVRHTRGRLPVVIAEL